MGAAGMYPADDRSVQVLQLLREARVLNERMRKQVHDGHALLERWREKQERARREALQGAD